MTQQIFEGTWEKVREEIRALDGELAGQHVRLSLERDNAPTNETPAPQTLAERFKGRIGLLSFEPSDLSVRTEELFGDIVMEKNRREPNHDSL